jgi:transcriptional regulator with XRE-family HTH domain
LTATAVSKTRPIDRHLGERLRTFRARRGMSLEDLAGRVGVTAAQLAAHEAGERMRPQVLYSAARALSVPLAAFFDAAVEPLAWPRGELAKFPPIETAALLAAWRRLDEAARRKALLVVQTVAEA